MLRKTLSVERAELLLREVSGCEGFGLGKMFGGSGSSCCEAEVRV